jgi:hypothetical protein
MPSANLRSRHEIRTHVASGIYLRLCHITLVLDGWQMCSGGIEMNRNLQTVLDAQIEECMRQAYSTVDGRNLEHAFARAIERAHGIGSDV